MAEREPDIEEDPRRQATGQGYPESNPEGTTPVEGTRAGPEGDVEDTHADAPKTFADEPPSKATGNPRAAGG